MHLLLLLALTGPVLAHDASPLCAGGGPPQDLLGSAAAPVPAWERLGADDARRAHLARLVPEGPSRFASWSEGSRRFFGLFFDAVYHEGWLDAVGRVRGEPFEDGLAFDLPAGNYEALEHRLGERPGRYRENALSEGVYARLTRMGHADWYRAWSQLEVTVAALHVGYTRDGHAEAHLEVWNPMIGPDSLRKHKCFEDARWGPRTRRSGNFYRLLRERGVPLSF